MSSDTHTPKYLEHGSKTRVNQLFGQNSKFKCQTVVHERQSKSLNEAGNLIGASILPTVKHTTLLHNVKYCTINLLLRKGTGN